MADGMNDMWQGGRYPLADRDAEDQRVLAYWAWLEHQRQQGQEGGSSQFRGDGVRLATSADGRAWVELASADQADFEALHMDHSIGHSWDKYSGLGRIVSLRSLEGLPEATILVAGTAVVHAREFRNTRLSDANEAALHLLAAEMGWTIKPDRHAFDVLYDPEAPNTRIVYILRAQDGTKSFGQATFAGRLSDADVNDIARVLEDGKRLMPGWIGLPSLGDADAEHELACIRDTRDQATVPVHVNLMLADLVAASARQDRLSSNPTP